MDVTRRQFLEASGLIAAGTIVTSPAEALKTQKGPSPNAKGQKTIYRLSLRGRRGSNAAKKHNANMRFATRHAADTHRAHPGDHSRIVPLTVSVQEFYRMFPSQTSLVADLRKL
jgi:hypothetical protein